MNRRSIVVISLIMAACLTTNNVASVTQSGQQGKISSDEVATILSRFKSNDYSERSEAFFNLFEKSLGVTLSSTPQELSPVLSQLIKTYADRSDQIKLGLIGLLEKENEYIRAHEEKVFRVTGETLTEDFSDYYSVLITVVADLKDPRAVYSLIGCISTGRIATSGLAALGRTALGPALDLLNNPDEVKRSSALMALVAMLDQPDITSDPAAKEKSKQALVRSARDNNHYLRLTAIRGFEKLLELGDADVIPLLEYLAQNDPYIAESTLPGSETRSLRYVVREAAGRVLQAKKIGTQ
jgi:hypothetical protein